MDHIPIPITELTRARINVPFLCTPRFTYDDTGFFMYPSRAGVDFDYACLHDKIAYPPLAPFLQAWLWFGLLGETLGIGSRTHVQQRVANFQSFIKTTEDGRKILTTEPLRDAVRKRRGITTVLLDDGMLRSRFDHVLSVATEAVNAVLQTVSSKKHIASTSCVGKLDKVHIVLLSVQILIESLRSYRSYLFAMSSQHALIRGPDLHHCADLINIFLREAGWCQSQIKRLDIEMQIQFFLSSTFKHERCPDYDCKNDNCGVLTRERTMDTTHTNSTCLCEKVEISDTAIIDITERGRVPVITYAEVSGGCRQLEIKEIDIKSSSKTIPFVAFSHVRYLGLGNSSAHSLPHCQLALLQELSNDNQSDLKESIPFYIDTMCVPLHGRAKKEALRNLAWVYSNAFTVVVLDPSLTNVAVGSDFDALVRIRYSVWKSRLWTLQEGSLAKGLVFRFANRTYDLDEILRRVRPEAPLSFFGRTLETCPLFVNNGSSLARVQAFDRDMKSSTELNSIGGPETKTYLRSMLRLGYLGVDRYRFFRLDEEHVKCLLMYQALEEVYFEPLSPKENSEERSYDRLKHLYSLLKSLGVK
jgi:hypothetical protein